MKNLADKIQLEKLTEKEKKELLEQLIQRKLDLQKGNNKEYIRSIYGSIIVIFSSILPYLDNIFSILFPHINDFIKIDYFYDFTTALWTFTISFSTVLIIFSIFFQVHKLIYVFPLISALISSFATIFNSLGFHISGNIQFYTWIVVVSFFAIMYYKRIFNYIRLKKVSEELKMDLIHYILKK